jgi:hypothetical protein
LISAAISGEAHCCQVIRGTDFNLCCLHNLIVAAMASIYIIGILVSEDKSTRIFYQLMLYEKYLQHNP